MNPKEMLKNSKAILNRIALNQVLQPTFIPDSTLAIGDAENYAPVPVVFRPNSKTKEKFNPVDTRNSHYFGFGGRGEIIDMKEVEATKDYYFGEATY